MSEHVESTSWFSNAPWWLVSAGLHLVIVLIATLIAVERLIAADTGECVINVASQDTPKINEPAKPTEPTGSQGLPTNEPETSISAEPIIKFDGAEESDHNESADNEPFGKMKGDSEKYLTYVPGEAGGLGRQNSKQPGFTDVMGVGGGGGGGGRHGGPQGGIKDRRKIGKKGGPTQPKDSEILAALKWLARHQNDDGGWSGADFAQRCRGTKCRGSGASDFDAGVTGLSLLAFLGAGYSQLSHDEFEDAAEPGRKLHFGETVKRAIRWLASHQDAEGCVGGRGPKYMYNHAIAALALSEAYAMTSAEVLQAPAQKAIDFLISAQNPGKGWRYERGDGQNDSSVTGWCVMALKSAEMARLSFPKIAYTGALAWFDSVNDESDGYGRTGYTARGQGIVHDEQNKAWDDHPALTAVSIMSRLFIEKERSAKLSGAHRILADLPKWETHAVDYYYWYYASLALFQYDGPKGPFWTKWSGPMDQVLVKHQRTASDGCARGSWDTEIDRWSHEGGRVYATAINALTLEATNRYASVFGGGRK